MYQIHILIYLCTSSKKGAYCFTPVSQSICQLVCLTLSVSLSVRWSIVYRPSNVRSISFHPFACKLPNLVQWMPLESRCFLLIFRSHDQRPRSNCWSSFPLCWKVPKLGAHRCLQQVNDPYSCSRHMVKGQGQTAENSQTWQ